jgi:hypothetical protein
LTIRGGGFGDDDVAAGVDDGRETVFLSELPNEGNDASFAFGGAGDGVEIGKRIPESAGFKGADVEGRH